jgi:hypothetical protein
MQALVVIFKYGLAFRGAAVVFGRGVGDVAGEDFLPEGEAAGWAWGEEGQYKYKVRVWSLRLKGSGRVET